MMGRRPLPPLALVLIGRERLAARPPSPSRRGVLVNTAIRVLRALAINEETQARTDRARIAPLCGFALRSVNISRPAPCVRQHVGPLRGNDK
jgi:hypothetical protein